YPMSTLSSLCLTNSPHWRCRTRRSSMTSCSAPVPRPYKRSPEILATSGPTSASFRSCILGGRTYWLILTSTVSFPPQVSRPTVLGGFIPAIPSSCPFTYSVASSAASSSPAYSDDSSNTSSPSPDLFNPSPTRKPSAPSYAPCSVRTGSSTPSPPSAVPIMSWSMSPVTPIASPSPTAASWPSSGIRLL